MTKKKYLNKEIVKLIWSELKNNHLQVLCNTIVGIIIISLDFLFVWLTKQTIDIATGTSKIFSLKEAFALLIATLLLQICFMAAKSWINTMLNTKATNKMQLNVFRHALSIQWLSLCSFHSGDIINRIEKDVSVIVNTVTESLPSLVVVCLQFCGAFVFLYLMDRHLALFVVIIIPFFLVLGKIYVKKMRTISRKIREIDSNLQSQYQEGICNAIVLKTIHNAIKVVVCNTKMTQETLLKFVQNKACFSIASSTFVNIGFVTAYLFAFIWGTYHLSLGIITYGTLIAFVQLVGQIQRPARGLVKFIPDIINALTSGERLLEIRKLNKEETEKEPKTLMKGPIGLKLYHVFFDYNKSKSVLTDINYNFLPASRTLITAPTGRGKTTLIRLMLALFNPKQGCISIYNTLEEQIVSIDSRRYFAYVPQGNTLINGTIRNNLKLSAPNASDDELFKVLKIAKADFVNDIPQGLSSKCGENGVTLSEGQAQRLCIARALLLNAPILLLDEATSALDEKTESEVLENIVSSYPQTTIIIISHRPKAKEFCTSELKLQ